MQVYLQNTKKGQSNFLVVNSGRDINLPSSWEIKSISDLNPETCAYVTLYAKRFCKHDQVKGPDMGNFLNQRAQYSQSKKSLYDGG